MYILIYFCFLNTFEGPEDHDRISSEVQTDLAMSNSSRPPALLNYIGTVQLRHMVAGISGGVVSTLLLHPLDLLKIRW